MGTHTTDKQTGQYDPTSMSAFKGMTGAMSPVLQGYMSNPFSNPFFQQQQQLGTRQAQGLGGTQMGNISQNMRASGIGGGGAAPFQQEMMANQARANSGMQAQLGFLNPVSNALGMQQNALSTAAGYRPLQTGQTDVKTTGGVGTWLPQIFGAALGAINPLKGLFGGGGGGGGGGGATNWASFGGGSPSGGWANTGAPQVGMGGYGGNFPSPWEGSPLTGGGGSIFGGNITGGGVGPWFGNQQAPGGYGQGGLR